MMSVHKTSESTILKWSIALLLLMIALIPVQVLVFALVPPPTTVIGFFELFHTSLFKGLLSLDLLYIVNNSILAVIYLSLAWHLYKTSPFLILTALLLGSIGVAAYYASNPAFEMMILSGKYYLSSGVELERLLSAGEAMLANYEGSAFISYYFLNAISLLLFSIAFYKSNEYPKKIAIFGFISAVLMSIPSGFGLIGMIFSLLSLIPWIVFCLLIAFAFRKRLKSMI